MIARRGEVWLVDSNPIAGHEQGGRRPALVLSVDAFNASRADLVTVLPITSRARALRSRVAVQPPEGGLSSPSYIIAEQVICGDGAAVTWRRPGGSTPARADDPDLNGRDFFGVQTKANSRDGLNGGDAMSGYAHRRGVAGACRVQRAQVFLLLFHLFSDEVAVR